MNRLYPKWWHSGLWALLWFVTGFCFQIGMNVVKLVNEIL